MVVTRAFSSAYFHRIGFVDQAMEIAVAFGGRRLSTLLRTIIDNVHHL